MSFRYVGSFNLFKNLTYTCSYLKFVYLTELRMNVRSSLYTRAVKIHEHEYGEEIYQADEDEYSKTCLTCGYTLTYDKM